MKYNVYMRVLICSIVFYVHVLQSLQNSVSMPKNKMC